MSEHYAYRPAFQDEDICPTCTGNDMARITNWPCLAERIALAIEAQMQRSCDEFDRSCACAACVAHEEARDAARVARTTT